MSEAATRPTTPAVGGARQVPLPDPVARDYILLALRIDQHSPGTVDGYFGPADLKAQVDMEQLRPPRRLAEDAAALRARLSSEVADLSRQVWLDLQLVALETQAVVLAGDAIPYLDEVTRCFAITPQRRPAERFEAAAAALADRLPGEGTLADRLAAEDDRWTVAVERLPAVLDVLVARFRARAAGLFGLPEGEDLRIGLVRNQAWSGYNWYDGGYRSRMDINVDLPIRLPSLTGVVAHETYPGHHLEHVLKEQVLVEGAGRLESSVLLLNTPECLISEGLAELGRMFASPRDERADLLAELAPLAGLELARDPVALGDAAERAVAIADLRSILDETRLNAALLLHVDRRPRDEVIEYLVDVGRFSPPMARKRLEFLEHRLSRTYVFVYVEGEALLRRWLERVPEADQPARFGRLLRESLTPPAIRDELGEPDEEADAR